MEGETEGKKKEERQSVAMGARRNLIDARDLE